MLGPLRTWLETRVRTGQAKAHEFDGQHVPCMFTLPQQETQMLQRLFCVGHRLPLQSTPLQCCRPGRDVTCKSAFKT